MAPVISFVGWSEVGKTTLIEQVVRQLKKRRYKVAVIKHTSHEIQLDAPGKDTWRFREAGSDAVALSGPGRFLLAMKDAGELSLSEICSLVGPHVDVILTEGYKTGQVPRIEVRGRDKAQAIPSTDNLVAVVSDAADGSGVPRFGHADSGRIADFIVDTFIRPRQAAG